MCAVGCSFMDLHVHVTICSVIDLHAHGTRCAVRVYMCVSMFGCNNCLVGINAVNHGDSVVGFNTRRVSRGLGL